MAAKHTKVRSGWILIILGLCQTSRLLAGTYGGGSGIPEDPYQIWTAKEMNEIGLHEEDWGMHFKLMADIDLSGYDGKDGRGKFTLIRHFWGVFDGDGHSISSFVYDSDGMGVMGLFREVQGFRAVIKNVVLSNPNVDAGVGGSVGSLIGRNIGTIENCQVQMCMIMGGSCIGGLVGNNQGTIIGCSVTGKVQGQGDVGGLAGLHGNGEIRQCTTNICTVYGETGIGGLVGNAFSIISDCRIQDPNVFGERNVGGVVGNFINSSLTDCRVIGGEIRGSDTIGGLVGASTRGQIAGCSTTCDVAGTGESVGGLAGSCSSAGFVIHCDTAGKVTGKGRVGGLLGSVYTLNPTIEDCSSMADVEGEASIGGLVGHNMGTVRICSSTGNVTGGNNVGGLVGWNDETIERSFATGTVTGTFNVGGLVGGHYNTRHQGITNCYAAGVVQGLTRVGGLVGVKPQNYLYTIENCYSSGSVVGSGLVGGLVGAGAGIIRYCYWDMESSGQTSSISGEGKTTLEMKQVATYFAWGGEVWTIDEGIDYPRLKWENQPGVVLRFYSGGSGTTEDPFLIGTAYGLNTIGKLPDHWSMHFKLIADIDMSILSGVPYNVIGYENFGWWTDSPNFTGVFDGEGHVIRNFVYEEEDGFQMGIFGCVSGKAAVVKNVGMINPIVDAGQGKTAGALVGLLGDGVIENCWVEGGRVSGYEDIGGLVGENSNWGTAGYYGGHIIKCRSSATVSGHKKVGGITGKNTYLDVITGCEVRVTVTGDPAEYIGGLAGINDGEIIRCHSNANVVVGSARYIGGLIGGGDGEIAQCSANVEITTGDRAQSVGGLAGTNDEIIDCSVCGKIAGGANAWSIGGLAGSGFKVSNCYSAVKITLEEPFHSVGGLIGNASIVQNSFWDKEVSGWETSNGGEGKTTEEMFTMATFRKLDWDLVWHICEGMSYPRLRWEIPSADFSCPYGITILDFSILAQAWQSSTFDDNWNSVCDLNGDEYIGVNDLVIFSEKWLTAGE